MSNILFGLLMGFVVMSCSPRLSPFTSSLITGYQYDDEALSRIQFYLSDDIVLHRQLSQGESTIDQGRIIIRDGRRVEEIIFREGTPGVFLFSPGDQKLAISFERGEDRYLMFGPTSRRINGRNSSEGIYGLLAKEWERDHGIITYAGREYYTPNRSAYVTLLVDMDSRVHVNRRVKEVGGRTVRR